MGNRAVICFDEYSPNAIGLYLHWNGGRDSIDGFILATKHHMGDRLGDAAYTRARMTQIIGTFFRGNLSFGLDYCKNLDCDNYDNGVYVIDSKTLEIKNRLFNEGHEQKGHDPEEIAYLITKRIKAAEDIKE